MQLAAVCIQEGEQRGEWTHITSREHVCEACIGVIKAETGLDNYAEFERRWNPDCLYPATTLTYITERLLPYWLQCKECKKWRKIQTSHLKEAGLIDADIEPTLVMTYQCSFGHLVTEVMEKEKDGKLIKVKRTILSHSCDDHKEECQVENINIDFIASLAYAPLLKFSPVENLISGYYPDGVGQSVIDSNRFKAEYNRNNVHHNNDQNNDAKVKRTPRKVYRNRFFPTRKTSRKMDSLLKVPFCGANRHIKPFYQPGDAPAALTFRPDCFEPDEAKYYSAYSPAAQRLVLAIRNLIITVWSLDPSKVTTITECMNQTIVRGLIRAVLPELTRRVLRFATAKGCVNFGCINVDAPLIDNCRRETILIVGAGPAGLSAASQLSHFGYDVRVFEARGRIGGRVDDGQWDERIARGAMVINGCQNNPFGVLTQQMSQSMHILGSRCDIFVKSKAIPKVPDSRMELHFNSILDILSDWRSLIDKDIDMAQAVDMAHKEFVAQSSQMFSKLELKLLEFHIANLEYACGADLSQVSALNWDQNEHYPQFQGDHTIMTHGFSTILEQLAKPLNISFNQPINSIVDNGNNVTLTTRQGQEYRGDRVLVTVPLALLKKNAITFEPPLRDDKRAAIDRLGAGLIEKVALRFEKKWWNYKIGGADFFGCVDSNGSDSGVDEENDSDCSLFNVFYDIPTPEDNYPTLVTIISGASLPTYHSMSTSEIVKGAMAALKTVFKEVDVPEPVEFFATKWGKEEFSQMSYSYVKIGASGTDYDVLAQPHTERILFAGEATNRHFPQTVTGAFLSGQREAYRVFKHTDLDAKSQAHDSINEAKRTTNGGPDARMPKARRRSDRSRLATSYVELDEDLFCDS